MALLMVQLAVKDYGAWRAIYDTLEDVHRDWGVTSDSVHQLDQEPNKVLVLRYFATTAQAHGFLTNREVQAAMDQAGIEGDPRIEIYA